MDLVFHEKQDGALCAQHCLNALLQGAYFSPSDLSELANEMDKAEREQMAAGGVESEHYLRYLQEGSGNMDDSGFFSVQVLAQALKVWDLDLVPLSNRNHPIAVSASEDPTTAQAFICNYRQHWFTIRKIGHQWFNLNSLLTRPELISESYLSLMLAQLRNEGYTIFIVIGQLPHCEAHDALILQPAAAAPAASAAAPAAAAADTADTAAASVPSAEQLRLKRAKFLEKFQNS